MTPKLFVEVTDAAACGLIFPKSPSACQSVAKEAKNRALDKLNRIYSLEKSRYTFHNTAFVADVAAAEVGVSASILAVAMNVSPDEATRDEANKQMVELQSFFIDSFESNKRLYDVLKSISEDPQYKADYVEGLRGREYSYWLDEELKGYRRRGLELSDGKLEEVVSLQKELTSLCVAFSRNISEDKSQIVVSAEELLGVPESLVDGLQRDESGKFVLKMDYPTYFGVMKDCEVASTRRAMLRASNNKAYPVNEPVLKEIVVKRHKLAELLGFSSYGDLNLDNAMAKSPRVARDFVDSLIPRLQKKWVTELELIKDNLHESCLLTEEGRLRDYDVPFVMNHIMKTKFNVSETEIQEYFPLDTTVKGLFDIYEKFFDITFKRINNGAELWHSDAFTLHVLDNRINVLLEGSETEFSPALAVVLANFPAPSGERPSLFRHDDVITFFHEFGHALHSLFGRSRMATFAGTKVKRDFVELPSQMLEEWVWDEDILSNVSGHYKTGKKLPSSLVKASVKSRNAFSGWSSLRQLEFATYSLDIFSAPFAAMRAPEMDTSALMRNIRSRINPHIECQCDTHVECGFGHLTGYGAGYYGYMWSKVFAVDLYTFIKRNNGLLDPVVGRQYVSNVIGVGGGRDPDEMLKSFLGREPNTDAFFESIGV